MRQSLGVDRDMTFDAGDFFPRVVPFKLRAIGILDALRINDAKTCFVVPTLFDTGRANLIFLTPAQASLRHSPQAFQPISENRNAPYATSESPEATSATDNHFSANTIPRKKLRTDPRCAASFVSAPFLATGVFFQIVHD